MEDNESVGVIIVDAIVINGRRFVIVFQWAGAGVS